MNCQTGELRRMTESLSEKEREEFIRQFKPVPKEHEKEANELLGDQEQTFVDLDKDTPLVNWAKAQRKDGMSKAKRKMVKKSRKQNRKRK